MAYGQRELIRIPSLACTIASSRVIASTPPFEAVSNTTENRSIELSDRLDNKLTGQLWCSSPHQSDETSRVDDTSTYMQPL